MTTDSNSPASGAAAATEAERFEVLEHEVKANNLIKNHVMMASAASLVPAPLFDVAAIMGVQLRLIAKLAQLHGKSFSEDAARNTVAGLVGGVFGHGAGILTALSLTKLIPGFGWMLGAVSLPILAGSSTYAIGRVYARHFESGGSIYDISVESVRAYYNEQLKKGRRLARAVGERARGESAASQSGASQSA